MMPNPLFNSSDSKSSMVESKTNNSAAPTTTKNNNPELKHNNSLITNNNNVDTKNNNSTDVKTNSDSKANADAPAPAQGDGGGDGTLSPNGAGAAQLPESQHSLNGNKVCKTGPLFLPSKGIGWTSWKKRWFVLTQTSLVFFRSDPNAAPQRGGEVNLTLGGIDLNSSGSVVVKADKKLLTVLFPDGRDGRAFTLKAETTEDLNEWKVALEEALANAPSASPKVGQNGTLTNEKSDTTDGSSEHSKDRSLTTSVVLGRPILLALEDIDGTPSFLEKALRYVEDHGVKVEGILRQAADVEDVDHRIREYEQGKVEFTAEEDAHVIGDCIKYVLRELPSSPVPASCCNALLDAYRSDRATRVSAMRAAICDTFPEPNRRLLQRILIMMETVADNKTVNRMSVSAVAACMAPLLLRPLLAGECNLDGQFNMGGGGDGSAQLLQAAAAANHAQAIVITLLEEYDNIFGEGDMLSDLYSDSEELGSESEELSEDEIYEDDEEDGEYSSEGSNAENDSGHASTSSQSGDDSKNGQSRNKGPGPVSRSISHKVTDDLEANKKLPSSIDQSTRKAVEHSENENAHVSTDKVSSDNIQRSSTTKDRPPNMQRMTSRRTGANKTPSNVNADAEVEKLEVTKRELKAKVDAEAKGNSVLKEDLLNKKKALEAHRLELEQDVARLEEQLQKETELRKKLETGIKISQQALFSHVSTNEKAESDVISLNQNSNDLEVQSSNPGKVKDSHEATSTSHDSKGDGGGGGTLSPQGAGAAQLSASQHSLNGNKVYKTGPLFLPSKGIGWTSWKKRWFVLTQTSLVFFRSDPNAAPQKGGEVNLTLGGIDLNSSGSVVVKADKKLLTVLFPDGRDGRTFTLKAETTEDLNEWKAALEEALANAPSASPKVGQNGTFKNEKSDTADGSSEHSNDRSLTTSVVLGRPILLALEDTDGTPSFLEKALCYVEDHGVKVEGILRQAADVEDVDHRIREYEQGKVEFTAEEDAHVIGDCIKYVLRELPSSPVPASCCNALLDAYRSDRATRVSAMRAAICDTFPEPNRRLLQRILIMMEAVADNKTVNRMSVSAVAACMAPLLLRPLLAGECNLDGQFNMGGGDGSAQLLQAAAAANHAQAIVITLIEEYDNIFGEEDMLSDLYSDSEELGSESEEIGEDEIYEDDEEDGEYSSEGSNEEKDSGHASTSSQSGNDSKNGQSRNKGPGPVSRSISHKVTHDVEANKKLPSTIDQSTRKAVEHSENENAHVSTDRNSSDNTQRSSTPADRPPNMQRMTSRRTGANKTPSNVNEEAEVERLEVTKGELKAKVDAEAKGNSVLKDDLLNKKKALEAHRSQLEQDVARLEEQLQKEVELKKKLETGIKISQQALFSHVSTNEKAESDVISLHQNSNDLEVQSSNPRKVKDSHDAIATSHESKDNKHQFQSFSAKLPPHKKLDPTRSCKHAQSSKDSDDKQHFHSFSSRLPPSQHSDSTKDMKKCSTTKPKRLNSRNETTGTNSAMSKITNGLNFLKERSNQLADEFQLMNKDRNKSQSHRHARKDSQDDLDIQSSVRPKESQLQHLDSQTDRGRRSDDQSTNLSMDNPHEESSQQTNLR